MKKLGRPLPVEYLLIDVPVSTPKEPMFTFPIPKVGLDTPWDLMSGHVIVQFIDVYYNII